MCIRHELSPATSTSASVSRTWRALSAPIATDTSAFFIAKVPPKPQHSSADGQVHEGQPVHRLQQPARPVAHAQQPERVAGRVVGDAVREGGADVGHAEHVDEELAQLVAPSATTSATAASSPASPERRATISCWCRADPAHEPDGVTTAS